MNERQKEVNRIKEENIRKDIEKYGEEFFKFEKIGKYIVSEEQKQYIIATYSKPYEDGKTIAKRFGVSNTYIKDKLKSWDVNLKSAKDLYTLYNKKNEDFFEYIDSEEKAYWLGFIYADGCLQYDYRSPLHPNKVRNGLKISLQASDKSHLEKLRDSLEYEGYQIIIAKQSEGSAGNGYYARFSITSKKMVEDLMDKGITPSNILENKSGRKEYMALPSFDKVPEQLYHHFIRGYFDGDGSLTKAKRAGKLVDTEHYTMKFLGNKKVCEQLKDYFKFETLFSNPNASNIYLGTNDNFLYSYERGGNHNVFFHLDKIYGDANIYLDRKKKKVDSFMEYYILHNELPYHRALHHDERFNKIQKLKNKLKQEGE